LVTTGGAIAYAQMKLFATAITHYLTSFNSYINPLLHWGQWLFLSLLTINLVWMALWHAFDQDTFSHTMPTFIRRFFVISVFYTIMIHPEWLTQLLQTSEYMGGTLTKISLTPQAIILAGIKLSNKIMIPLAGGNLLTGGVGFIVALLVSLLVLFVFLMVSLDLLVTLITATLLISMASFFLGLAPQSETVGRQALNAILRNCMKLFGLYVVVAVGLQAMKPLTAIVPMQYTQLDPYVWISAVVLLFWLLSKNVPRQLSAIIIGFIEITPTATSTNLTSSSQTLQTLQTSATETMGSIVIPSLVQAESSQLSPMSTTLHTTLSNGNLSTQFGQIVRKLATRSRMTNPHKNNKKSKVNK
jgi:P-type conjugative transfer protein TrbL